MQKNGTGAAVPRFPFFGMGLGDPNKRMPGCAKTAHTPKLPTH